MMQMAFLTGPLICVGLLTASNAKPPDPVEVLRGFCAYHAGETSEPVCALLGEARRAIAAADAAKERGQIAATIRARSEGHNT